VTVRGADPVRWVAGKNLSSASISLTRNAHPSAQDCQALHACRPAVQVPPFPVAPALRCFAKMTADVGHIVAQSGGRIGPRSSASRRRRASQVAKSSKRMWPVSASSSMEKLMAASQNYAWLNTARANALCRSCPRRHSLDPHLAPLNASGLSRSVSSWSFSSADQQFPVLISCRCGC
jgi:hypothetical protein